MTQQQEPHSKPNEQSSIVGADALVGRSLKNGRYKLVRVLATGGMARIYEAIDTTLERTVAIKILLPDTSSGDDETLTMRFKREANAVAGLEHPNIVRVYDYGEDVGGVYFIVMNLVRGKDLAQELGRLRRAGEKMPIERALHLMVQMASALDEAHRAGIIHRDIKPSNILVDDQDRVTLTDFGLLLRPSTDTTFGTAFGTPRYISPEQAIASNKVTPQSDIYSLAVIFYEMLTGRTPFTGDTPMEIALAHIHDAPPPPSEFNPTIPPAVEQELLKALDKTPDNRHRNAMSFVASIRNAYGLQIDDTPPRPMDSPSRPTRPDSMAEAIAEVRATAEQRSKKTKTGEFIPAAPPANVAPPVPKVAAPRRSISAKRLAESWDVPTSTKSNRRPPFALIGIVLAVIAVIVVVIAVLPKDQGGGADLTPTAAATNPTDESSTTAPMVVGTNATETAAITPTPTPIILLMRAIYTDSALTLLNASSFSASAARITFRGQDGSITEIASHVTGGSLRAGECFRIKAQRQIDPPIDCQGRVQSEYSPNIEVTQFFWRSESSPDGFAVLVDGQLAATCAPVRRGESAVCAFSMLLNP
ncbi:MAG: serine/threonine-protein kinase [Anaerolineae bacterium]